MQMPPPLLPYSSTAIQRRKKLRNPTPTVVFSFPWTVRGKGGSVGGAGGEGETFGALYWFPLAPCIAFAFKRAPYGAQNQKVSGRQGYQRRGKRGTYGRALPQDSHLGAFWGGGEAQDRK